MELQILPPNMAVHIHVVFRDMTFFVIFSKNFQKTYINFFFAKSEIPNPVVGSCQSNLNDCESCLQV